MPAVGGPRTVDRGIHAEKIMTKKRRTKLVREGQYVAEVEVELIDDATGWAPYLSLDDARKLDDVREALRRGDLNQARHVAQVFKLTPIST
jgi:hypothetical protein